MSAHIFDGESTGLNEPVIIEAAWLKVASVEELRNRTITVEDEYCERFNPGKPIEAGAMATHHIIEEDLFDCRSSSEFKLPDDVEYLVGHNIDYDWALAGKPDVKRICTLALSRQLYPQADSHNLSAMLYLLGESQASTRDKLKDAHSASADVRNCALLLCYLMTQMPDVTTWEDLWMRSELARIPTVMPFGKHKGEPIEKVPSDYKRWLLNQPDVDPYLRKALGAA